MSTSYAFGIDGGGTHSRLRVFEMESGRVEKECRSGSTNPYSVGEEAAKENVRQLILSAGVPLTELKRGCLGSAGVSRPAEKQLFRAFFDDFLPGCRVYLCNDAETLLAGSLQGTEGYCLICGTGSIALARSRSGELCRSGGLGYMLGDEGSALWIGWQAIRRALRAREGRDLSTDMLPLLQAHFSLEHPDDFVAYTHQRFQKAEIASAARLVLEAAAAGDPLARDIAHQAARETALLVKSVMDRLPLEEKRVALAGGVVEKNDHFRALVLAEISRACPGARPFLGRGDALTGACILALQGEGAEG